MSKMHDLAGATLEGVNLEADTHYINGILRFCTVRRADNVTVGKGIVIVTGPDTGLEVSSSANFLADGVTVTCDDGIVPVDAHYGISMRNCTNAKVINSIIQRARMGICFMECDGIEASRNDIYGCGEDGIRAFGCQNGLIAENEIHDFCDDDEALGSKEGAHRDGIQIAPFYTGEGNENLVVRDNLFYVGKGVEFTPIFHRTYGKPEGAENPKQPDGVNVDIIDNLCFTQGGAAITQHGNGKLIGNLAVGYDGPAWANPHSRTKHAIGKVNLTRFTGTAENNQAEHFYYRDAAGDTYRKGWMPEGAGNELVEPYTLEQIEAAIAEWRGKFRPVEPVTPALPEGLTDEVLAFLDARYGRAVA